MSTVLLKDYAYTTCHIQKMVLYTQTYIRRYGVAYAYHVFEICSLQCCLIECHSFIRSIRGFENRIKMLLNWWYNYAMDFLTTYISGIETYVNI